MKVLLLASVLSALCLITTTNVHAADDMIESAGDVLQIVLPLTALTATYTLDDPEGRKQLIYSFALTQLITHSTKYAVGKERPDGSDNLSFPSGHTSSAFSGAAFLAKRYGWDVGVPAYLSASFVGYSRVHANKHDWWDVAAGAALAIGINHWLVDESESVSLSVLPTTKGVTLALNLSY